MPPTELEPTIATRPDDLARLVSEAGDAPRLAVDLEASGMFAYRARVCTVQLAWEDRVAIVDALATPAAPLAALLGPSGPVKIVHDVAFDARMLAEAGIELGRVHDTSLMARMLGRKALGLSALLETELGVRIAKDMQHHDWRVRPLDATALGYLGQDVVHLVALDARLWTEVEAHGIAEAVLEETGYRIGCAVEAVRHPEHVPPYRRIKGAERLSERELAALRAVADLREREAERRDVPPHRVATHDALLAVARARPKAMQDLRRIRGVPLATDEGHAFGAALIEAVAGAGETLPEAERASFERPRVPAAETRARRDREGRLMAWRRATAAERHVDEQVVLPGHCLKDTAESGVANLEELGRVPGIGSFRVLRDGEAIVRALRAEGPAS